MFEQFFPIQDPVLIFGVLISIALIAPLLFGRLKMPGVIGLIVSGIVLGPHGLGVLDRHLEIELLSAIGLLYIMFLAGLELDLVQFLHHRRHSLVFGLLTFTIPLVLGSLMGKYYLGFSWPASVLLASMFSSHTLLTYPIASRLGLSRNRAVTTTIGGTLFTDTAALLVLAVIAASFQGQTGWIFWVKLFSLMIVYLAAMVLILPRLGNWFFRSVASDGVMAFMGVLSAVYICAYLAHLAGLEPIIGAFLAGLILNSLIPEKSTLMNRLQFVGESLFIPFFLISVGMLVNVPMLIASTGTWKIAGAMIAAGMATKWLAARVTGEWFSYSRDEGNLIYGLSVNQAAATLAAVLVGYEIGIFGEPVVTGTVMMILVTSLVGSFVTDRFARKVALAEETKEYQPSTAPHRFLIPLANPETAEELLDLAFLLRSRNSPEPLHPLTVARAGAHAEERIASGEKLLGYAVVRATAAGVPVVPITRAATDVPTGILQALVDLRISTIIAGWNAPIVSHQRTFGRILDPVIEESRQMVVVSRCQVALNTLKRVVLLLPPLVERQPGVETTLRSIKNLAGQLGAELLAVGSERTLERARKMIGRNPPLVKTFYHLLEDRDSALDWLKGAVTVDDLLVLVSVRKGRLAWQPILNRLPRLISQEVPGVNLIVVYPPEMSWGVAKKQDQEEKSAFCSLFLPLDHIRLDLRGDELTAAIRRLLRPAFPGREEPAEKLAGVLSGIGTTEPVELIPGAVLLHSHVPEVEFSTAFLGVNRDGWELPHTSGPARVLFLLLSPRDAPPETHLQVLSELARLLHRPEVVERLTEAETREEALRVLWEDPASGAGEIA
ncbi:MAG: cation:proton antiporter [Candidatus Erginobacter occultus]|nr:cation:proton antiporter [Candidatus Erginobacter occultus]